MPRSAKRAKGTTTPTPASGRLSRKRDGSRARDLEKRLAESLEQQTATSEVLKVISRSPFDLQSVLETPIENATKLCDASYGHLSRFDGAVFRVGAFYGTSPEYRDYWQRMGELHPGRGSVLGRIALEQRTVQILDVLADPEYQQSEAQRIVGFRTVLGIPMLRGCRANRCHLYVAKRGPGLHRQADRAGRDLR